MKPTLVIACLALAQTMILNAASIHDIAFKDIDGKDTSLAAYRGKVLLIHSAIQSP